MALFFVSLFISRYPDCALQTRGKKLFANCVTAICTVTIRFVGFHSMLKSSMFFIMHDDLNKTVIFSHIVKCYIVNVNLCIKQRNKRGYQLFEPKKPYVSSSFFLKRQSNLLKTNLLGFKFLIPSSHYFHVRM